MRTSRWCVWPVLALCAAGCASGKGASRASSGSATEQRAAELEARNAGLQAELSARQAELVKSFQTVSQAEGAAGLNNLACVGVSPVSAPVPGLPRSGAEHARFSLRGQSYRLMATFAASRTQGAWRLAPGTCKVGP
jgi:hypothetical protein